MNNELNDILRNVAEETFESMAFLFTVDDDEAVCSGPSPAVATQVTFQGPFNGTVAIVVPADMLAELVGNMLGYEDETDLTDVQKQDGFRELANVICGNLLPALAGRNAVFDVQAPQRLEGGAVPETLNEQPRAGHAKLLLDSGWAELALYVKGQVPQVAESTM